MPAKVESTPALPGLSPVCGKPIIARFDGGKLSSDGGVVALREIEARLSIANRLAACVADPRAPERVVHSMADILRFRMLMIAAGYEDANDADSLRHDPAFKLALGRLPGGAALCSQPTISRLENLPRPRELLRMGQAMVGLYCDSFRQVPRRITLDIDDTFDAVHGGQQLRLFNVCRAVTKQATGSSALCCRGRCKPVHCLGCPLWGRPGMFAVEIYAAVRSFVFIKGNSRREAARVFGLSRETVLKMCRFSLPPGYTRTAPMAKPKLGALLPVIDAILEADRTAPIKQRYTAKRIFERLRDEHGFAGGYTVVKDHVWLCLERSREIFVPLAHRRATVRRAPASTTGSIASWLTSTPMNTISQIARHPRCYGLGAFVANPLHYLALIEMKPNALDQGRHASLTELAAAEKVDRSFFGKLLSLTLLVPDLVEAILEGRCDAGLPTLLRPFPASWHEQTSTLAAGSSPAEA